jgi:hypothetical protein
MTKVKIKRGDGVIQRYSVKLNKKFRATHDYDRKKRIWTIKERRKKKLYRSMIVRTYYANKEITQYNEEIADFRVEIVSNKKISQEKMHELEKILDRMELIFKPIFVAIIKRPVNLKVTGIENNVRIDADEAELGIRRHASFCNGEYVYDEEAIQRIEIERMKEYKEYKKRDKNESDNR